MKERSVVKEFLSDEGGLETIEYAIIAGLITVGVIVTVGTIGLYVRQRFERLLSALNEGGN